MDSIFRRARRFLTISVESDIEADPERLAGHDRPCVQLTRCAAFGEGPISGWLASGSGTGDASSVKRAGGRP